MSTRYDVYGIGNALVDKEFRIDDAFLQEAGIEKGYMTLLEEEQQAELLDTLQQRFGLRTRAGGGSAANTLYALSQFGGSAFYSCKVANDETGDFYVQALGDHNIETNLGDQREAGVTGRCLVMVSEDAERTMLTHLGISQSVSEQELRPEAVSQSGYVYIEGYLVTSDTARKAAITLKQLAEEKGVRTAFTFSDPSMVQYFSEGVNEVLGLTGVDLLFCNQQEALIWSGESDIDSACQRLEEVARQFVVTQGRDGALLFDGERYQRVSARPVQAVDSNGAGDLFAGAFFYGLSRGFSFHAAGELASLAAGTLVTHYGPRLTPEQHQTILEEFTRKHAL